MTETQTHCCEDHAAADVDHAIVLAPGNDTHGDDGCEHEGCGLTTNGRNRHGYDDPADCAG